MLCNLCYFIIIIKSVRWHLPDQPILLSSQNILLYNSYFNFREAPFSIAPDPRFLYMSPRHREGLAHLLYGIHMGGFVILTGEVGTGKTTLCRSLLEEIPEDANIALILNPKLNSIELQASICDEFEIPYPAGNAGLKVFTDLIFQYLLDAHARGRKTVLMIDEAQNLSFDLLEQIRLLTNLETSTTKLLQIILVGQPELKQLLNRKELRQLNQRITARYHLQPLSLSETGAYIRHRLSISGGDPEIFRELAIRRVYRLANGIPRFINILCDRALLGAYATNNKFVTRKIVNKAARKVMPDDALQHYAPGYRFLTAIIIIVLLVSGFYVYFLPRHDSRSARLPTASQKASAANKTPLPTASAASSGANGQPSSAIRSNAKVAAGRQSTESTDEPGGSGQSSAEKPSSAQAASTGQVLQTFDKLIYSSGLSLDTALTQLLQVWSEQVVPGQTVDCNLVQKLGLRCMMDIDNLGQILSLNRPVILEFASPDEGKRYGLLIGVARDGLPVIRFNDDYIVQLDDLMSYWKGYYLTLWKPPYAEIQDIHPGYFSDDVLWLRQQLESINGKAYTAIRPRLYDKALQQRIKAFQRQHQLFEDGIVGPKTIIHLQNSMPVLNFPLLETTD